MTRVHRRQFLQMAGSLGSGLVLGGAWPRTARAAATDVKGTVRWWHVWDGARLKLAEDLVTSFQQLYPNVRVESTLVANQALIEKYTTAIAGGDPPSLIMLRSSESPALAARNALQPLDDWIARDKVATSQIFYPEELRTMSWRGRTVGFPIIVGGARFMLFWNKDLVRQAGLDPEKGPKTWQELTQAAQALTVRKGDGLERIGFNPFRAGAMPPSTPFRMWLYTNNGRFYSDDGRKVLFNSEEGEETLEWLLDFVQKVAGRYENIASVTGADVPANRLAWYSGRAAMINEGHWHFFQLSQEAPKVAYGVGDIPYNGKNSKAKPTTPNEGSWGYMIPRGVKDPDAAWEFLKYASYGDGGRRLILAQRQASPVRAINESPELSAGNPHWPVVVRALQNTLFVQFSPVDAKIKQIVGRMEEQVFYGRQKPKEALAEAAKLAQQELDDWFSRNP
jgi:multiple sugar transport system substrate-binding protein